MLLVTRSRDMSGIYELLYNPKFAPRKSPGSHIDEMTVGGDPAFVLVNETTGEYYEVDGSTNAIWNLLDGTRTMREVFEEAKKTHETMTEMGVREVILSLAEEGTIESTEPEVDRKRVERGSAFQLNIHLVRDSSKSLAGFFRVTRRLIRREELPIALAISFAGAILFADTFAHIFSNSGEFAIAGSSLLGYLFYQMVVLLPVYAVHELAHAAVCDRYGGKPRGLGTGLYYLAPFFYCDTSDSWRLPTRARVMISAAGPLSTLVIAAFLVLESYFIPAGSDRNFLQVAAFFCFYGTILNLSPVLETDGYYVLADILKIPNLRDESFGYVKRTVRRVLGRPVSVARQSARRRQIFMLYSLLTVTWLVVWGTTSLQLVSIYGRNAYGSLSGLASTILQTRAFDTTTVGVDVATLSYFGLLLAGLGVMGGTAFRKLRVRGMKIQTIHDKRVAVFLPIPTFIPRQRAEAFVKETRKVARKFSRSFSVTWESPLCVAAFNLGKADESLDATRRRMLEIEKSFRALHNEFLAKDANLISGDASSKEKWMSENLILLANQFPRFERKVAVASVTSFVGRQNDLRRYLLSSAFGTVWTLELSPDDYGRIRREIFSSSIAEDLGVTDLGGELEHFKKYTVLGMDAIAQFSSEIEKEFKLIHQRPEVFQVTAFIEPVKSRLVFVGRTEKVEGSMVWIGGLFLYQAWTGYITEVLEEATLGLKSIRLARSSTSLTKSKAMKLSGEELDLLVQDLDGVRRLIDTVNGAVAKVEGTRESAMNFHEELVSMVSDGTFEIGLYEPILSANEKRLGMVENEVKKFKEEFRRISKELTSTAASVTDERSRRASAEAASGPNESRGIRKLVASLLQGGGQKPHSPAYDEQVRLMFATARLVYGVVEGSDIVT